ncbi:hypothetical protein L0U85_07985 [Glycomyces sp. L485]|uniref:isopenicillin N synthase family dioxygenase n=1 Tax=Glycomyces sp. L485 TaxID=2909235 RepID=UPI001F4B3756|nr:2OG-Fe(II) oxygenase family protein [Glycomyces sp. L485]MCH7230789.1 hypothetical protein [Glycomyces sp. L485]
MSLASENTGDLPHLDLAAIGLDADDEFAKAAALVDAAFSAGGFLRVTGHTVPRETVDRIVDRSRALFRLDRADKDELLADLAADPLTRGLIVRDGHTQFFMSMLTERHPIDGVPTEYADFFRPNRWPAVPQFREAFIDYYEVVEALAHTLMRLMATALGLPRDWLVTRFAQGVTPLVANHYPPYVPTGEAEELRHPAHRDWGAMTILHQDEQHGGLQVRDVAGNWVDVSIVPGSFIVNIGMLMERWTGGRWNAALHRVAAPPLEDRAHDRFSVAYFCQPDLEVPLTLIPGCGEGPADPETSGGYYRHLAKIVYSGEHK